MNNNQWWLNMPKDFKKPTELLYQGQIVKIRDYTIWADRFKAHPYYGQGVPTTIDLSETQIPELVS